MAPVQTYALYLPAGYTPEKRWPIVFVLDPRGRARTAADLFVPGAERFGYVVCDAMVRNRKGEPDLF